MNNKGHATSIFLIPCLLIMGCAGSANLRSRHDQTTFQQFDKDDDGRLALSEFSETIKQSAFDAIDKNKDGKIEVDEWLASNKDENEAIGHFNKIDRDGDRKITFLEFSDAAEKSANFKEIFSAMDKDRDGSISPDDFSARPSFKIFSIKF